MSDIINNENNQAPTPQQDSASVYEFGTIDNIDVLSNDSDPEGDNLTVISAIANSGSAFVNENNTINYTAGSAGIDTITYTVQDIFGNTAQSFVIVDVLGDTGGGGGFNNPPVANEDFFAVTPFTTAILNVLNNDTDPDSDTLTIYEAYATTGSVSINGDGTLSYTASDEGTDRISYSIQDSIGNISQAFVYLEIVFENGGGGGGVNNAPMANDDYATTDELTPVSVNVVTNDIDIDDDSLILDASSVFLQSGSGTISIDGNVITVMPDASINQREIIVNYSISDGSATSSANLIIDVSPTGGINTPPVANSDNVITLINQPITVNVLANDTDADNDNLVFSQIYVSPDVGQVVVNEDNTVTFTPNYGFVGLAEIQYSIQDSSQASASSSLFVNVQTGLLIEGTEADDEIVATLGSDTIFGFGGNDLIIADDDSEYLEQDKDDILIGGTGNDFLVGGNGNDVYIFNLGDGQDVINNYDDTEVVTGLQGYDRLLFGAGITSTDIEVSLIVDPDFGNKMIKLSIMGTTDSVAITGWYDNNNQTLTDAMLDEIVFADGTVWTKDYVLSLLPPSHQPIIGDDADNLLVGTDGDDEIQGLAGDDTLEGGSGNDLLEGGSGDDVLVEQTTLQDLSHLYSSSLVNTLGGTQGFGENSIAIGDDNIEAIDITAIANVSAEIGTNGTIRLGNDYITIYGRDLDTRNRNDLLPTLGGNSTGSNRVYYDVDAVNGILTVTWDDVGLFPQDNNNLNAFQIQVIKQGEQGDYDVILRYEQVQAGYINIQLNGQGIQPTLDLQSTGTGVYGFKVRNGHINDSMMSHNTLVGGQGNDLLIGGYGHDTYLFNLGDGQDTLNNGMSATSQNGYDRLVFGAGINPSDIDLRASGYDLILAIKNTTDSIRLVDFISSYVAGIDAVEFADGTVWDYQQIRQMPLMVVANGNGVLNGMNGNDTLIGSTNNDLLSASAGDDVLIGGMGNDNLNGDIGNDTYIFNLGDGQDLLADYDNAQQSQQQYYNRLVFGDGIHSTDIELRHSPMDSRHLLVSIKGTTDSVTVINYFDDPTRYGITAIEFADGTIWTTSQIVNMASIIVGDDNNNSLYGSVDNNRMQGLGGNDGLYGLDGNDTLEGGTGDDTLLGGSGDDVLQGDAGNDTLSGGLGNDVYIFNLGDGQDIINTYEDFVNPQPNLDVLRLGQGISAENITLNFVGDNNQHLVLLINGTSDSITIENFFEPTGLNQLQAVQFADGTVWSQQQLLSLVESINRVIVGDNDDNALNGTPYDNIMQGLAGNDNLLGGNGDDSLDGGAGHDTLDGGLGNDSLYGGDAAQQQEIVGYQDVIVGYQEVYLGEQSVIVGYQDVIIGYQDVYVRDEYVYVGDQTVIVGYQDVIVGYQNVYVRDEYVYIGDQSVIVGYQDIEIGQDEQGQPIYENQAIYENQPVYGWQAVYEDQPIYESQPIYSTEPAYEWRPVYETQPIYENQAIYEWQPVYETQPIYESQAVYGLVLVGGNDNLYGGEGDDTLQGGAGNDYLAGGIGNDTYIFNLGDGQDAINNFDNGVSVDRLVFGQGIHAQDVDIQSSDNGDLILAIKGTTDTIRLINYFYSISTYQLDVVEFADGTTWTANQIEQFATNIVGDQNDNVLNGNALSNIIQGLQGNDYLNGHRGNDTLIGGLGNDTLDGSDGSDTYVFNLGDGQDVIYNYSYDASDIDILSFGAGIKATDIYLTSQDTQLRLNIAGTHDSIFLADYFYYYNFSKIDQITFADGTVWTTADLEALTVSFMGTELADDAGGSSLNDIMYGQGGNDQLNSGYGNDTLDGGTGHDYLNGSDGNDSIYGGDAWQETGITGYQDVITGYQEVFVGYQNVIIGYQEVLVGYVDVFIGYQDVYVRDDLVIIGYEDIIVDYDIEGQPIYETRPIEIWQPVYENQAIYRQEEVYESQPVYNQEPVYENQPIYAQEPVYGLVTVGGDDTLYGGDGDDILIGGQGNDYLNGGHGNDTYVFNLGDGQDTINNLTYNFETNSQDTLVFGQGINTTDIHLIRENDTNLKVNIIGTTDRVTLNDYFDNGLYSVNQIKFADGTTWTYDDVIHRLDQAPILTGVQAILANGVEDQVYTISTSDLLQGFTDINHDVLSVINLQITNGILLNNQNSTYSFIADSNFNGVVNLNYQVIDTNGNFVDAHLDLVIESVNDAPILFDIPTPLANAIEDISYTLYASDLLQGFADADGDLLSIVNLQVSNGNITDNQNGTYTFTTSQNFNGTVNISYQVTDGQGGIANAFNSLVIDAVNDAPTINPNIVFEPKQIDEHQLFSFTFAEDVFVDMDGDQLSYMAMQANGDALPSWLSFDGATRTFMGTPSFNDAANLMLKVVASDGMLSTEQVFSLMVNNVNRLPTGSPTVVLANVEKGIQSYNVALSDLLQGFEDADGDLLTISNLTADHATVINNNNGTYTLTLEANYDGVVSLNYQVTDGLGGTINAVQHFNVVVDTTGTSGADILIGGSSNDTYIVNNTRDVVVESHNNGGIDTVESSLSYNLGNNLENLVLVGATNLSGVGNNLDNMLMGNDGNNRLLAGLGNDTLYGGAGGDTLNGGEGADVMKGGLGNDTFTIENANDLVVEFANEGYDTVNSFITYTLTANVERLNLENLGGQIDGFGNDLDNTLNGNNFANYLFGGAGNDTLQGKGGADTLEGGLGDDVYYVDNIGDMVNELANQGTDKVNSTVSYTLTANVEQLYLTGIAGLSGTGNAQNNIIYGNSGNNLLNGGAGNDSLNGGAGNDSLDGGSGNDTLVGGLGNDSYLLAIGSGRDTIDNKDSVGNDVLLLGAGITAEQVWLRQLGNDLEVSIIGTNNSAKVKGWYGRDAASQIDSIQLSTGNTLLASEVQYLVEAMAAFTPPPLGQTTLNSQQQSALGTTIAIVWETITGTA